MSKSSLLVVTVDAINRRIGLHVALAVVGKSNSSLCCGRGVLRLPVTPACPYQRSKEGADACPVHKPHRYGTRQAIKTRRRTASTVGVVVSALSTIVHTSFFVLWITLLYL